MNQNKRLLNVLGVLMFLTLSVFGIYELVDYSTRPFSSKIVNIENSLDKLYFSEPSVYKMFKGTLDGLHFSRHKR